VTLASSPDLAKSKQRPLQNRAPLIVTALSHLALLAVAHRSVQAPLTALPTVQPHHSEKLSRPFPMFPPVKNFSLQAVNVFQRQKHHQHLERLESISRLQEQFKSMNASRITKLEITALNATKLATSSRLALSILQTELPPEVSTHA